MRCPTLNELPVPQGKTGWPWTEESPQLPETMPDGRPWPRISIITPSYNQGHLIEETVRSVLLQGYPNLEFIIIDGASTDRSVDIIRKYASWLASWISEPDRGQAHAINQGWARATGDIYAWLNSDDLLVPGSLTRVAAEFSKRKTDWLCGGCTVIDASGREVVVEMPRHHRTLENMIATWEPPSYSYPQMSSYVTGDVIRSAGPLREDLAYVMDHEYWLRLVSLGYSPALVQAVFSCYRLHPESKTVVANHQFIQEAVQVANEYSAKLELKNSAVRRSLAYGRGLETLARMKQRPLVGSRWELTVYFLTACLKWPSLLRERSNLRILWLLWTEPLVQGEQTDAP